MSVFLDDEDLVQLEDGIGSLDVNDNNSGPSELNYRLLAVQSEDEYDYGESLPVPMYDSRSHSNGRRRRLTISSLYEIPLKQYSLAPRFDKPKVSDFDVIKVLGRGAYGKVLLVKEKSTNKLYAMKQLKKALLIINNTIHEVNYNRTVNEKTILQSVNHPNIVKLYYAFQDHNKLYLILEYLDGGELFHHLAQERYMPETKASYYIAQLIVAIRYLHVNLKVIYRDLKPENCMLNSYGHLVLTDFGLSKQTVDDVKLNSLAGTAQYMAPEILKGEEYDFGVDWWSLGCVCFDLLTGSPPFTGNNNKKVMDKVMNAKKFLKFPFYLSLDAKDFLRKLLQVNPMKRVDLDDETQFKKIMQHRFFRTVDWKTLNDTDIIPPILPVITDPILAENFDDEFTNMPFTPPDKSPLDEDILQVKGFSFVNESVLEKMYNSRPE
ncbi:Ribosomal protein S6 kinase alpha-5 [Scheffersomyces spartinae]|uniref:Ribosomal protein S6 kinase alpha-5 n=1 Tax=Scheffersomyces spartinae TaxID=45513 RepID=A0A9P8AK89_9ASCO|nr:Ribosomal protein S6 kinase alpha-5 [Scheffersomyces spartinae]KAG7196230.1 Ribosomal protein S6 kinase alpha-5 [Scheffersomyces spartinae]